jgi:Carboxypeptidase regulatory-like domain
VSERKANRTGAAAGAILVALAVAGLWFLLGDAPEEQGSKSSALSRGVPATSRPTKPAPPRAQASSEHPAEARPDGVLEVEVFSKDTPVAGAQVQVYAREPADLSTFPARWTGRGSGETGADGRWVLPVAPGSYYVTARAPELAPGYVSVVHVPGSARTRVRLRLEASVELLGTVLVKGTDEPVSLAEILLTPPGLPSGERDRLDVPEEERLETTSSETGAFRFSGLAPGRYRLEARAPGYVSAVLPLAPVPFRGQVTLLMVPGAQLEGTVIGTNGEPASGAVVLAEGYEQDLTAVTDGAGRFSLDVPPGHHALSARRGAEAGALEQWVNVTVGQRVQGLRIQLGAGAEISGKVVRPDGSPIVGARVEALSALSGHGLVASSHLAGTNERGDFSVSPLAPGRYGLQVFLPEGTEFGYGPIVLGAGEHAVVKLTSEKARTTVTSGIQCQVQDAANHPVQGVHVRATALWPQTSGPQVEEGRTDAKGLVLFAGMSPGPFRVEARRNPETPGVEHSVFAQRAGGTRNCTLWLSDATEGENPSPVVEGRVLPGLEGLPPGEPVVIEALPLRQYVGVPPAVTIDIFPKLPEPVHSRRTWADAQGRFRLILPPGEYTLRARRQHRALCGTAGERNLKLEPGQHVETTLSLEERAPELRVQVRDAEGAPVRLTPLRVHLASTEIVQTDEQGRLDICLPGGPRQSIPSLNLVISSLDDARAATVEVPSAPRELTVSLRPPSFVQGRILHSQGLPVRRFTVDIVSPGHPPRSQEFMGDRFELSNFPVGPSLIIISAEGLKGSRYVSLRNEERTAVDIPLYPPVTLKGRLVDAATGRPVRAAVSIPLFTIPGVDDDGRFVFHGIPAGETFLTVSRTWRTNTRNGQLIEAQLVKVAPEQDNDLGDIPVPGL